ncbi:MAG: class I SAM-dependent methyltransferase [Desulfoarculaceae bacterium]|nr:class I SAM-dependent methyltransferase [Desulfoarculaceae bacterium]
MIKYHQDHIDFASLHQNNIDRMQLEMIPAKSHVLEIGCATGYMTEYLARDKQCRMLGVEPAQEQAEMARKRGLTVITGLIESQETLEQLIAYTKEHGLF